MGVISRVFGNLQNTEPKYKILEYFNINRIDAMESWIRSLSNIRNICAHHGRLWNQTLIYCPSSIKHIRNTNWLENTEIDNSKMYAILSCSFYLLKAVSPTTKFAHRFRSLLDKYPEVDREEMGFPENWKEEKLWQ